jgi:hypothetical protein
MWGGSEREGRALVVVVVVVVEGKGALKEKVSDDGALHAAIVVAAIDRVKWVVVYVSVGKVALILKEQDPSIKQL